MQNIGHSASFDHQLMVLFEFPICFIKCFIEPELNMSLLSLLISDAFQSKDPSLLSHDNNFVMLTSFLSLRSC